MQSIPIFERLNALVHKRKTLNIGNPAVIIHKAYWQPPGNCDEAWNISINEYIESTISKIDCYIKTITMPDKYFVLSRQKDRPFAEELNSDVSPTLNDLRYGYIVNRTFLNIKLSVEFEKHDEFWSIKVVIDFSNVVNPNYLPPLFGTLEECLSRIEKIISQRYYFSGKIIDKADDCVRELGDKPSTQYIRFLSACTSSAIADILAELLPSLSVENPPSHNKINCVDAGLLYANFVGFSFGVPLQHQLTEESDPAFPPLIKRGGHGSLYESIAPEAVFPPYDEGRYELLSFIDGVWPIVTELNPYVSLENSKLVDASETDTKSREFTISRINRGRALYITSLGGIVTQSDEGKHFPLSYLMICPHRASWQIGRMLDRIHRLGIYRLASLYEIDKIERVNDEMRGLIDRLEANAKVSEIEKKFREIGPDIENGLHYRIEWSRFYMRMFESTLKTLDFDRVEGYQTYVEFVNRRISESFEAIRSTGRRFDYLSRLINERATFSLQKSNTLIVESSNKLLELAEFASVFPISYYSFHIIQEANEYLLENFGRKIDITIYPLWISISLVYACIAWRKLPHLINNILSKALWRRWR